MACHPRVTYHTTGSCHLANSMSWSQSYVSHCRVLPLGEFFVTIPEPHATLQGAVTWRNQCHDRATLHNVRIPSGIRHIENRFSPYFFLFLMQFRLWRATAFVSSPIHLFYTYWRRRRKKRRIRKIIRRRNLAASAYAIQGHLNIM